MTTTEISYPCPEPGCASVFSSKQGLGGHRARGHRSRPNAEKVAVPVGGGLVKAEPFAPFAAVQDDFIPLRREDARQLAELLRPEIAAEVIDAWDAAGLRRRADHLELLTRLEEGAA